MPCGRGRTSAAYRSAVPLALVSDIHGNDVALAAVVAELERLGIDSGRVPRRRGAGRRRSRRRCSTGSRRSAGPSCSATPTTSCSRVPDDSPRAGHGARSSKRAPGRSRSSSRGTSSRSAACPRRSTSRSRAASSCAPSTARRSSYDDVVLPETPDGEARAVLGGTRRRRARGRPHAPAVGALDRRRALRQSRERRLPVRPPPASDAVRLTPVAEYAVLTGGGVEFRRIPFDLDAYVDAGVDAGKPYAEEVRAQWQTAS